MTPHVSSHHRLTIEKIFHHPAGGNIEWREVLAMLEDLGTVTHEHNGKFTVTLGPETEVFEAPRGKDIELHGCRQRAHVSYPMSRVGGSSGAASIAW